MVSPNPKSTKGLCVPKNRSNISCNKVSFVLWNNGSEGKDLALRMWLEVRIYLERKRGEKGEKLIMVVEVCR